MKLTIPIEPMGAVRMTAGMVKRIKWRLYEPGDKKVETAKRYLSYKEKVALMARSQIKSEPINGAVCLNLTFHMPMPESWSEKKKQRMDGKPHTKKPDRDNLDKGVCDALNKIAWKDDGQVYDGTVRKFYSREPRIEIEILEVS